MIQCHSTNQTSIHILQAAAFYWEHRMWGPLLVIRETGQVSKPSFKINLSLQGS